MKNLFKIIFITMIGLSIWEMSSALEPHDISNLPDGVNIYQFDEQEDIIRFMIGLQQRGRITPHTEILIRRDEETKKWNILTNDVKKSDGKRLEDLMNLLEKPLI